ncbi:PhzF family phenazine biosynthesis protein [Salegentibacter sp. F188]|uniref:PhzF family phenazine biosynthesis protein n=1 Tax=Autumnicola patrickiae TaxID=3075591 RepID=A0ABU3E2Q2_9FLAO|nr:PhzF family phenazine biosynthesis protein [Salegentibacter sp. F188]MDT0690274.1 PhzF family phenazine biosynthesis protein [Salegentibacter sp. F188]
MQLHLYQIDAFTDELFSGNPACVVPLSEWPSDDLLLKIARENAVAETAFFVDNGLKIHLRWFTPEAEIDLCGHATLATAHALKEIRHYSRNTILFETKSGELEVETGNSEYTLNFPSRKPSATPLPSLLQESINIQPQEVLKARDFVLVYPSEEDIRNIEIDRLKFDKLELGLGGVIFTAPGKKCDFVSRFFTPGASVFEDPVTGSAHCSLIPYWSEKLNKIEMNANQISKRGGKLFCKNNGDRVAISGNARTYSIGKLWTE